MKKHMIRILTLLCLVCFGAALFTACGEKEPPVEETQYTVTYAAGGGTGTAPAVEKYKEGATFKVKENPFTKAGATFKTWNDGTQDYAAGATYTMPKKDVTFTAQWTDNDPDTPATKVTVTYSLGENKTGKVPAAATVEKGGQVTLPTPPAWAGHTFKGWKVGSDATLKKAGDKITVNENVTVTAQWEPEAAPVEQVTVTFALGEHSDGTAIDPEKVDKGEEYELPAGPAAEEAAHFNQGQWSGYAFDGWKIGDTAEVKQAGEFITLNADITLTAQWKQITFQVTGASVEVTENTAYVVVTGLYDGFTAEEFIAAQEDGNQNVLYISVSLGIPEWDAQNVDSITTAEEGEFTVKLDVTDLKKATPYIVLADGSGHGDIKTLNVEDSKDCGEKKYSLNGGSAGLTLTIGDAGKSYAFTGMKVEAESGQVYLTVSGTYSGYTDTEFKGLLEDADENILFIDLCNGTTWEWQRLETTITATGGTFEAKINVTSLEVGTYSICENKGGKGDIKWNTEYAGTITEGDKKYTIERQWAGNTEIKVETATPEPPATKSFTVTGGAIAVESDKAVITLSGTFAGYTKEEFKAAIEDENENEVGFRIINAGTPNWNKVAGPTSNEVGDNTFTVKFDVTAFEARSYYVNQEVGSNSDIKSLTEKYDVTVEVGEKTYRLQGTPGANIALIIAQKTPAVEVTFSEPTSATLEVMKSDGREDGKLFRVEVDAAFLVLTGTYTGEATLEQAQDYFSQAKFSFKFTAKEWKDRLRRISIDTSEKTWTVKFDVTSLPVGDNKCVLKGVDLKLAVGEDATNSVKSLGSTFTLKNIAEGVLAVNVVHNYAITGVDLEKDEDGTPRLVMEGTYEESVWTGDEIKKFLLDDDIRTLCLNLTDYIWPMNDTYSANVTAENGTFTVKLDISNVKATTDAGVLSEGSGYGDIILEGVDKEITTETKKYTLKTGAENKVVLTVVVLVEPTATLTDITLTQESEKVYLNYIGTSTGYTEAELKAYLENVETYKFWGSGAGNQSPSRTATVEGNTWTLKFDVMELPFAQYSLNDSKGTGFPHPKGNIAGTTIKYGGREYVLYPVAYNGNCLLDVINIAPVFSRPTSAKLELANDKGNGTDENFQNDINRAFFVISGTYTGEVTEAIAKEYFKQANYPFEFSGTKAKDRIRRISIDTEAHTYTVKFDVTALAEGNFYCRFNDQGGDGDLRLSLEACPNNTVKSVGSTFTLTNYYGQAQDADHFWACIILNVKHNYAVTGADLEEVDGKANLVVNGTFETSAFTGEQIEKFLKDEDIRSMCITVFPYLYPSDENYHVTVTTGEGTFTLKLDLSVLTQPSYGVVADGSGYGDIKNVTVSKTLTVGNKVYTLTGTDGANLTLTVADVTKEYAVTTAKIEQASEKINLVLSGTYAGYSEAEFTTYLQEVYYDIQHNDNLDKKGWNRLNSFARTVSVTEGQWTLTIDITKLDVGSYGIHFDSTDGVGGENENTKNLQPTDTQLNDKTFNIGTKTFKFVYDSSSNKAEYFWGTLGVIVTDTNAATISFTKAQLTSDESHVYLVLTATVSGYTQQDLETMIYIGELDSMRVTVSEVTLAEGVATLKFDFTEQTSNGKWWWGHYMINGLESLNVVCPIDTGSDANTVSVTMGGYTYTLRHNDQLAASANEQIIITIDPA